MEETLFPFRQIVRFVEPTPGQRWVFGEVLKRTSPFSSSKCVSVARRRRDSIIRTR